MRLFDLEDFSNYSFYHGTYSDDFFGDIEIIIIDDSKNILKGDKE